MEEIAGVGRFLQIQPNQSPGSMEYGHIMAIASSHSLHSIADGVVFFDKEGKRYNDDRIERRIVRLATIFAQGMEVLSHLSKWGVVLNDIKPENIFVSGSDPKAIRVEDFETGKIRLRFTDYDFVTVAGKYRNGGTQSYAAPERLAAQIRTPTNTNLSDVYSFGATIYFLMLGRDPIADFSSDLTDQQRLQKLDFEKLHQYITKRLTTLEKTIKFSSQKAQNQFVLLKNFIVSAMQPSPIKRVDYLNRYLPHHLKVDPDTHAIFLEKELVGKTKVPICSTQGVRTSRKVLELELVE